MADEQAATAGTRPAPLVTCRQCGNEVPRLEFCIRCGDPLDDEYNAETQRQQRRRFAAAPDEPLATVALSTLFPQLPRAEMRYFRIALGAGVAIVVALGLLGFFPMALVAAAVLVPTLMVLYLYVTDIYEDEPLWVYAAHDAVGRARRSRSMDLLVRNLPTGSAFGGPDVPAILLAGIALPLVEGVLMIAGPLLLLAAAALQRRARRRHLRRRLGGHVQRRIADRAVGRPAWARACGRRVIRCRG